MKTDLVAIALRRTSRYEGRTKLTDEELAVVRQRLSPKAARAMLYGEPMAEPEIEAIAARPAVAKAIRRGVRHLLGTRALPAAVEALEGILETSTHEANKIAAARALAEMAAKHDVSLPGDGDEVPVIDMTEAQLVAFVAAAQSELAERRAIVIEGDNVQDLHDTDDQPVDIFG